MNEGVRAVIYGYRLPGGSADLGSSNVWSSSRNNANNAWNSNGNNGYANNNNMYNANLAVPVTNRSKGR